MEVISNDQIVRCETVQDLYDFKSQSLSTQARKREQVVSRMPADKKTSDLMGDDIVELFTGNDGLKTKIGVHDGKWLEESKAKFLKQIDDEKRANLIMSRSKEQIEKYK